MFINIYCCKGIDKWKNNFRKQIYPKVPQILNEERDKCEPKYGINDGFNSFRFQYFQIPILQDMSGLSYKLVTFFHLDQYIIPLIPSSASKVLCKCLLRKEFLTN